MEPADGTAVRYSPALMFTASLAEGGAKIERPSIPVLRPGIGSPAAMASLTRC